MTKTNSKFWFGLTLGAFGGIFTARKLFAVPRMPNAKIWQRILAKKRGQMDAAVFMAQVQGHYEELKSRRPVFEKVVFNTHVVGNILPGLALYQALREDGLDSKAAIAEIDEIFTQWFDQYPPPNMRMNQLMKYTPENFTVFRRLVRFVMDKLFPAPGWQYEVVADTDNAFAFNIHHCFYIDILRFYKAPELTPIFCRLDDILMGAMPDSIRWGRSQTIGMGADFCNFRWDYAPLDNASVKNMA